MNAVGGSKMTTPPGPKMCICPPPLPDAPPGPLKMERQSAVKLTVDEGKILKEPKPVKPAKVKKPTKPNAWSLHVSKFRAEHPEYNFKEVLQHAKLTYVRPYV